ncbi:hypothetical protein SAMD00023353_0700680 [Rosellinia necatrix]|uniref:Uncharacterized protein n=1 Tax=Rosellinia necatrix TaxID=77044 RepID=A0A1S8A5T4_ROSNE|nr:hypothetical protein SAMD00023353_0700680 [Rosellinia necatrix]
MFSAADGGDLDNSMAQLFKRAEKFARACDLISLRAGSGSEKFRPTADFHVCNNGKNLQSLFIRPLDNTNPQDILSNARIASNDNICFNITSSSRQGSVYASLLFVDAIGEITILSLAQAERGIELTVERPGGSIGGVVLGFPDLPDLSGTEYHQQNSVEQHFVLLLTSQEIDLRFLQPRRVQCTRYPKIQAKAPRGIPLVLPNAVNRNTLYYSASIHFSLDMAV